MKRLKTYKISRIGLGTVQFGMDYGYTKKMSQSQVDEILNACQRSGVTFLDTARDYGDSEAKIGSYLKRHPREPWIIATKIKNIPQGICSNETALERHIVASVRTSVELLGRPVHILQLHNTQENVVKSPHLWRVIATLKNRGLFQDFGVSFYDPGLALWVLRRYANSIGFIQAPFNVFDQRFAEIFKKAKRQKIKVISRSTFLRGLIASDNSTADPMFFKLEPQVRKLNSLAGRTGLTISEIALQYAYNTKWIDTVLIGIKSAQELIANLNAVKKITKIRPHMPELQKLHIRNTAVTDPRKWPISLPNKAPKHSVGKAATIILQARMGSTRLPGKVLKDILGRPMLQLQCERLLRSRHAQGLVVATTTDPSDDDIEKFCIQEGIRFFRGSVNDVLERFYKAACLFRARTIVRITADCPLIDPHLIDHLVDRFSGGNYDYARLSREANRFPDGLDVEVISFAALKRAHAKALLPSEREHVTPYIYNHPQEFKIYEHENTSDLGDLRLTVDQEEDLQLIRKIYRSLYFKNRSFTTQDILDLLSKKPALLKINAHYSANEGYAKSIREDPI